MRTRTWSTVLGATLVASGLAVGFLAPAASAADVPETRVYLHGTASTYAADAQADPAAAEEGRAPKGAFGNTTPPTGTTSKTANTSEVTGSPGFFNAPTWSLPVAGTLKTACLDIWVAASNAGANFPIYPAFGKGDPVDGDWTYPAPVIVTTTAGAPTRLTVLVKLDAPFVLVEASTIFFYLSSTDPNPAQRPYTISYDSATHFSNVVLNPSTCTPAPTPAGPAPSASAAPSGSASAAPSPSASAAPSTSGSAAPSASGSPSATAATVTLTSNALRITAGNTPTLSGVVRDSAGKPVEGATVSLMAKGYGATTYSPAATARTDAAGQYKIVVRPLKQTAYGANVGDARSPVINIRVNTRVNIARPVPGAVSNPVTFVGNLNPAYARVAVGLGYLVDGRFVVLKQADTDASGGYTITASLPRGTYAFVVFTSAHQGTDKGSKSVRLTVS